jgi:hypothetical protein
MLQQPFKLCSRYGLQAQLNAVLRCRQFNIRRGLLLKNKSI